MVLLPFPHVHTSPQLHSGALRLWSGVSFLRYHPVVWPLDSWPADCCFPFCHLFIAFPFRPAAYICFTHCRTATQPRQTPRRAFPFRNSSRHFFIYLYLNVLYLLYSYSLFVIIVSYSFEDRDRSSLPNRLPWASSWHLPRPRHPHSALQSGHLTSWSVTIWIIHSMSFWALSWLAIRFIILKQCLLSFHSSLKLLKFAYACTILVKFVKNLL